MGRILYLFERKGVRNTRHWNNVAIPDLLLPVLPEVRFKDTFDLVIFAITGESTPAGQAKPTAAQTT
jgi:hypothetical protein